MGIFFRISVEKFKKHWKTNQNQASQSYILTTNVLSRESDVDFVNFSFKKQWEIILKFLRFSFWHGILYYSWALLQICKFALCECTSAHAWRHQNILLHSSSDQQRATQQIHTIGACVYGNNLQICNFLHSMLGSHHPLCVVQTQTAPNCAAQHQAKCTKLYGLSPVFFVCWRFNLHAYIIGCYILYTSCVHLVKPCPKWMLKQTSFLQPVIDYSRIIANHHKFAYHE